MQATLEGLGLGGKVRREGRIVDVPLFHERRSVRFADTERGVAAVPWGDVSTAYHSTGIPNVTVYFALPAALLGAGRAVASLLGWLPFQRAVKGLVARSLSGPNEQRRRAGRTEIWGEVLSMTGDGVRARLTTPEGYTFTASSALAAAERVRAGVGHGALTPAQAFGADFVTSLPGVVLHEFEPFRAARV
jgi:saccharopine dehydrogenase (NAD+, L-lysine-forming)